MSYASGGDYYSVNDPGTAAIIINREFYVWCNAASNSGCTSFNGTVGTGSGTLLPTNASAYSGAPNCTKGVGYFDTQIFGTGSQGELFICTATNTWTASYVPYTYPHPLTGATPPPPAPAAAMLALNGPGTVSGQGAIQ